VYLSLVATRLPPNHDHPLAMPSRILISGACLASGLVIGSVSSALFLSRSEKKEQQQAISVSAASSSTTAVGPSAPAILTTTGTIGASSSAFRAPLAGENWAVGVPSGTSDILRRRAYVAGYDRERQHRECRVIGHRSEGGQVAGGRPLEQAFCLKAERSLQGRLASGHKGMGRQEEGRERRRDKSDSLSPPSPHAVPVLVHLAAACSTSPCPLSYAHTVLFCCWAWLHVG
jgi:hypothetical protein